MLPPGLMQIQPASADERRLVKRFRALDADAQRMLLVFADFLAARVRDAPNRSAAPEPLAEPIPEARPAEESVVAAIKRLRRSYPMLDGGTMLQETSALMTAHVLQGRAAAAVIDELEAQFARAYAALQAEIDEIA
jgi:hypothetical protein